MPRPIAWLLLLIAAIAGPAYPVRAEAVVDLELVLLADATGSIDEAEIRFQRRGYAEALAHPEVLAAIAGGLHQRIAVTYVEWGDDAAQDVVVPWTAIAGPEDARRFGESLLAAPRRAYGRNAIGSALLAALALIEANEMRGTRRVVDLSADSANNWSGPPIETVRQEVLARGITINGLAVLCREAGCSGRPVAYDLERAFEEKIIGGPRSFVVTADGPDTFAAAVRRKLILEISDAGGKAQAAAAQ